MEKFFRLIYLLAFDVVYFVDQMKFLNNFERRNLGNITPIFYQYFEYFLIIMIYSSDFFNKSICINSRIENIYYKKNILNYDLILLFCDIMKKYIK